MINYHGLISFHAPSLTLYMYNAPVSSSQYIAPAVEPDGRPEGKINLPGKVPPPVIPDKFIIDPDVTVINVELLSDPVIVMLFAPTPIKYDDVVAVVANEADVAVVANEALTACKTYDADVAVVALPTNDPLNDPVATTVIPTPIPSNASMIFVIWVGDIVPPAVMPVLLIVAIYVVPFFVYRPIFRPFI